MIASAIPAITHAEVWVFIALCLLAWIAIRACRVKFPDPHVLQSYATVTNTKGGIILILLSLWIGTLLLTLGFGTWIIIRGVDPQHATVITILAMLTGTAFGNVNGALFKTMTGEDPKPPTTEVVETKKTISTAEPQETKPNEAAI